MRPPRLKEKATMMALFCPFSSVLRPTSLMKSQEVLAAIACASIQALSGPPIIVENGIACIALVATFAGVLLTSAIILFFFVMPTLFRSSGIPAVCHRRVFIWICTGPSSLCLTAFQHPPFCNLTVAPPFRKCTAKVSRIWQWRGMVYMDGVCGYMKGKCHKFDVFLRRI